MRPGIEEKINETLESLDGIQRAEPRPYFYARLMARMQRDDKTIWEAMGSFIARPAVVAAGLCFIIVLNGFILVRQNKGTMTSTSVAESEQLTTDNDYVIASSSSFEYENLDPQ